MTTSLPTSFMFSLFNYLAPFPSLCCSYYGFHAGKGDACYRWRLWHRKGGLLLLREEGATAAFTYVKSHEDKDARETLQMLKQNKTGDAKDPIAIPVNLGYSRPVAARWCSHEGVRGADRHEEVGGGFIPR
ncbi:hypothetical protein Cni_G20403 [Canna indica]|uniref:Uncharacterized protein n=1 Tax=Canna indica TaxID=4628 RepID=A0AAQ3QHR0_9LILI|nr:hypothetical protein Cni_G20403 [Canna indica]